jgi:hypothetical protein
MTTTTTTELRVTCSVVGTRNDQGKDKLVTTIVQDGLNVWCRYCRKPYFIPREVCIAAWERGETVVKGCGHQ